jgi:hypothetical protein
MSVVFLHLRSDEAAGIWGAGLMKCTKHAEYQNSTGGRVIVSAFCLVFLLLSSRDKNEKKKTVVVWKNEDGMGMEE